MAGRRSSGVLAMLAEAQREQHRREEARRRAAEADRRAYERAQREAQRSAAQGRKEALRAYQQGREADAARRTAELDARVDRLRGVLAAGLAGPAFHPAELQGPVRVPPFDPGPLGVPVPMPDQAWYLVPPPVGAQAADPAARRRFDAEAAQARARYEQDWYAAQAAERQRLGQLAEYRAQYDAWAAERLRWAAGQAEQAAGLVAGLRAGDPAAVVEYFETALRWRDDWPEGFPVEGALTWDAAARRLVVERRLPGAEVVPAVARLRYVKADDREAEVARSATERRALYREVLAQCALRVLDALLRADPGGLVESVVLNGFLDAVDPATGREERRTLVAVAVERTAFRALALDRVSAVDCLVEGLGGRLSARPEKAAPVKPELPTDPAPMVAASTLAPDGMGAGDGDGGDGPDLFEMDPIAFEELIAELFRRRGLRTSTTARSGDEGVDVLAEDPDPITGGRIVIQAKRYRHTVPPAAVRDLDATMVRQGANRGILVTTSGFGPGSRRWAEGKPLTLVDGPTLVRLLHEQGLSGRLGGTVAAPAAAPPAATRRGSGGSRSAAGRAQELSPGQNVRPEPAELAELTVVFGSTGAEADLTLLLLAEDGRVRSDEDFVFYHQPTAEGGAVTLRQEERTATLRPLDLPGTVHRVAISVNMDADSDTTCAQLRDAELRVSGAAGGGWSFRPPADPAISAMLVAELYRNGGGWKLRAVGQGWADGLAGLARAHGVEVA
ncbi:restriction endonuclease [Kitasatospora camelliae]|uniref:Restriction endonuclease n=1 Tax=Kitasatospora camelliae TaxID=3156397 RepID=A0AAU8JZG4_9ACTN